MPINQYEELELFELFFGLLILLLCISQFTKKAGIDF